MSSWCTDLAQSLPRLLFTEELVETHGFDTEAIFQEVAEIEEPEERAYIAQKLVKEGLPFPSTASLVASA
jgi:hypothetical protein